MGVSRFCALALPAGYRLVQQAQSLLLEDDSAGAMQLIMMGSEERVNGNGAQSGRKSAKLN